MTSFGALEQALELFERPELASVVRVQPLPNGVLEVIRIAADHAETIAWAQTHTGRTAGALREAATFYVQQALFAPNGDPARTIGAHPDAPYETLRTHAHTLLKWLHPDARRDDWEATFAERVASAWDALKRERGRNRSKGETHRASRPAATTSDGRPKLYRTTRRTTRRRRDGPRGPDRHASPLQWPTPPAPRRLAILAAAALGFALIGYQIVATAMADSTARTDPAVALAWRPHHAAAHAESARLLLQKAEEAGTTQEAEDHLQAALAASPVAPGAFRMLGLAADASGDGELAAQILTRAGRMSNRDTAVELWLLNHMAGNGDYRGVVEQVDTVVRTRSGLRQQLLPVLLELAMAEETRPFVVDVLAQDPPWREWFFAALARQEGGAMLGRQLMTALNDADATLTPTETARVVNALAGAGAYQLGFLTWVSLLPPERRQSIPYVYNGDFEFAPSGVLFDWMIRPANGARTEVVDLGGERGNALRVAFSGRRIAYNHLTKMLLLAPGHYRLTGLARADALETERGLTWGVTCATGRTVLASTPPFKGTFDWQEIALDITVPPDCPAQVLSLALRTEARLDLVVAGTAWFDSLAIARMPVEPAN